MIWSMRVHLQPNESELESSDSISEIGALIDSVAQSELEEFSLEATLGNESESEELSDDLVDESTSAAK